MSAASKLKDQLKFSVEITKGPHAGVRLSFAKATVSIGRGPENDIVLTNDPRTSRQHAQIKQRESDFVIINLSQKNFVLVNGQSVQTEILTNSSVIQIGDTEIRFQQEQIAPVSLPENPPAAVLNFLEPAKFEAPVIPPSVLPPVTPPLSPPIQNYRDYQAPPNASYVPPSSPAVGSGGPMQNSRVRFYGIVVVLGAILYFFLSPSNSKNAKDPNAIRTSVVSLQDVAQAEKRTQELMTIKKEKYDSVQYRRSQENFVKGFRDFQQGQYARAREAFQVVLNLDPENELAKRYFHLSKIKFDELVKFNMIQGNRYREKKSWRMCQSNYSNVLTMLQNRKDDPTFKEAKQFYEECTLNLEGRF